MWGRQREKQVRIGQKEKKVVKSLVKKIKDIAFFSTWESSAKHLQRSTMDHLRQNPYPLDVRNKKIPAAEFVGEQFRPEFYVRYHGRNCAVLNVRDSQRTTPKLGGRRFESSNLVFSSIQSGCSCPV